MDTTFESLGGYLRFITVYRRRDMFTVVVLGMPILKKARSWEGASHLEALDGHRPDAKAVKSTLIAFMISERT